MHLSYQLKLADNNHWGVWGEQTIVLQHQSAVKQPDDTANVSQLFNKRPIGGTLPCWQRGIIGGFDMLFIMCRPRHIIIFKFHHGEFAQ